MAQLNKTCKCCSTKYSYCPDCSHADELKPSWYHTFCSESCKELWLTFTRYNMNRLTKSEAKEIVSSLELKPIDAYAQCIQRDYAKVMVEDKKPKRGKRAELNLFDEALKPLVAEERPTPVIEEKLVEQEIAESHEVINIEAL